MIELGSKSDEKEEKGSDPSAGLWYGNDNDNDNDNGNGNGSNDLADAGVRPDGGKAGDDDCEGFALLSQTNGNNNSKNNNNCNLSLSPHHRLHPSSAMASLPIRLRAIHRIWHKPWLGPDDPRGWTTAAATTAATNRTTTILDAGAVRLLRFFLVTATCLVVVHYYAASITNDKHDETYDLQKMVIYDGIPIATDTIVFFVVGRLYDSHGGAAPVADSLAFVVPLLAAAIFQSWGHTHLKNLQHSITPYEMACEWTWPMYLLVLGGCLPVLLAIVVAAVRESNRRGIGPRKLAEFVATVVVFWGPYTKAFLSEEGALFLHVHHWYYAWFLGMHCNLRGAWWSDLATAVLWGIYVNGVAIFGRDPVLTCAVSLYRSQSQVCPYIIGDDEAMRYGSYTLGDLARDSGHYATTATAAGAGEVAAGGIVCANDVTRWL